MRLLLVDDDPDILENNAEYLSKGGYDILTAGDSAQALALCCQADLIILDVGLPDMDGFSLARLISERTAAPLLFLTARGGDEDMSRGLELGMDYMRKPYSVKELLLRIHKILRQPAGIQGGGRELGSLCLDWHSLSVAVNGVPVPLTPREFSILAILAEHPGEMFTYQQIYGLVWGAHGFQTSMVAQHFSSMRRKLEGQSGTQFFKTYRGLGYALLTPPIEAREFTHG